MSQKLKILTTAKQAGSVNVLAPAIKALIKKGHKVTVYATGNENESVGFKGLPHQRIEPNKSDYPQLVKGFDKVIVGLSGYQTPDGYFLRAANKANITTIAVQDQDAGYPNRLGNNPEDFPTILAVMNKGCLETIAKELGRKIGGELASRAKVVGWVAFDDYGKLKNNFNDKKKKELLRSVKLDSEEKINIHLTQNIHQDSDYIADHCRTYEQKKQCFYYEMEVTKAMFETASDMGLKLTVKPHPGEEFTTNHTLDLVKKHGFTYLPHESCDTKQLMLASDSITAGRSTCLTEACLLDKNTGGILPGLDYEEIRAFPPIELNAIPYTTSWKRMDSVIKLITSEKPNSMLAEERKRFSVDGKATQRLIDLIENL